MEVRRTKLSACERRLTHVDRLLFVVPIVVYRAQQTTSCVVLDTAIIPVIYEDWVGGAFLGLIQPISDCFSQLLGVVGAGRVRTGLELEQTKQVRVAKLVQDGRWMDSLLRCSTCESRHRSFLREPCRVQAPTS